MKEKMTDFDPAAYLDSGGNIDELQMTAITFQDHETSFANGVFMWVFAPFPARLSLFG
jgi:hypothetical protein